MSITAGASALSLAVTGTNFTSSTAIQLGGVLEVTTYVSATQVTAAVGASQLLSGGNLAVVASNGSSSSASGPAVNLTVNNPAPALTQIFPVAITAGTASASVSVLGTGMVPATVIQVNGSARSTAYVSPTQANVVLTATDLVAAGSLSLMAVNPSPGGGASTPATLSVTNPAPGSIMLSPSGVLVGAVAPTVITVTGSNFLSGTTVQIGNTSRTTTFVSATQVTFPLSVADQSAAGTLAVTVVNPAPGGGISTPVSIAVNNPLPGAITLNPGSLLVGATSATTLTVTGSNFLPTSTVVVGGAARTTTYINATQLSFSLNVADQEVTGSLAVTVANPAPGGGISPLVLVTVNNPLPGAITLNPVSVLTGAVTATAIAVSGTNFVPGSIVQIGSIPKSTTYIGPTQLSFQLNIADQATAGTLAVTVLNPAPGGGSSAMATLAVTDPLPGSITVNPGNILVGTTTATLVTVTGTSFLPGSTVQVNGAARTTTSVSPTQLTFALSTADQAAAASLSVTVVNPPPGGGVSTPASISINNPVPGPITVSPNSVLLGTTTATMVTVTGSNFVSGATVQIGGVARSTTFVNAAQLSFSLSASDQAAAGSLVATASNPAPGGGISTPVSIVVTNPVPGPITLSPNVLPVGGMTTTTVTVTGTNFTPASTVQVGGTGRQTTYVSGSQVSFQLTVQDQATASSLGVNVLNPLPGGGASGVVTLAINNPVPTIAQITPASFLAGAASTSITVLGTNFVPSTLIQFNGSSRVTTYVSSTQLSAMLTQVDLSVAGAPIITALNAAPGGGISAAAALAVNNPVPQVTSLSPSVVIAGTTTGTTITLTGTNFQTTSVVQVGATSRSTTYISPTKLTFQLTAADQTSIAALLVSVVTPAPGGGMSSNASLIVASATPTPVLTSVSPANIVLGSSTTLIAVSGSNIAYPVVQWNGTTLPISGYAGTYVYANVPASLLTSLGTASVTVSSLTATPSTSNALTVSIVNPPPPTLTAVSPAAGPINTAAAVTLSGTGFTAASTVTFNGANLPATYNSTGSLSVAVPASSLSIPGTYNFAVTTPSPGGGTTTPFLFTAYVPIVNNSMIYNPVNGLFYLSIPSSAGATYGNSIVSLDPATGALGTPIRIGSEPNKLALSSDGTTLWVGLDGASSVRQVNLTTGIAGLQFGIAGNNGGIYANPSTAYALAALPGSSNSVVVSSGSGLGIYDSGVLRGSRVTSYVFYALQVNGTRNEIYAGGSNYVTYTYGLSGLVFKAASTSANSFATNSADEMQITGGNVYTDYGQASDAESGALLGTFYATGATVASGPTVADTTLGKVFILDNASGQSYSGANQIQIFNLSNYTASGLAIPVTPSTTTTSAPLNSNPSRLTRWGANGLAFRTGAGVFSLRSNLVKDLSATSADLGVALAASGPGTTGTNTTYSATIGNAGSAASTNVVLLASIPSTGVLLSATPSVGTCSTTGVISCDLGGMANAGSATVTFVVQQTTAGSATMTVQVSGPENDPSTANNQASSTAAITGAVYNVTPVISSISPSAIQAGTNSATIAVTGSGFGSGATVQLAGTALPTSYSNTTQLTATVSTAQLASLGWSPITVLNPAPGGGVSNATPLTVFSVITLGANHLLYDPFSRNIMASVGSGSSTVTGNSIVAITPQTSTVGTAVPIGSQPTKLALTADGQILYTILTGSLGLARYNMLTQQADFAVPIPGSSSSGFAPRDIAAQPGTENTVAVDLGEDVGNAIFDLNPVTKTAAIRGSTSGPYTGSCLQFLDANDLFSFDIDTTGSSLDHYTVTSSGFTYYSFTESTLSDFGCFKLSGGLAFANLGGVANPATTPATQIGVFSGLSSGGTFSSLQALAPDASLQRDFFAVNASANSSGIIDGIAAYDQTNFLLSTKLYLNMETIEGNTSYTPLDLIRWGQDGLAALTSGGHIYLLRGPVVVPQLLSQNTASTLTSSSVSTIAHGSGNTLLTLTGSNFIPGVAVTWNGSYRTTTIVSPTQITVAVPASDLTTAGTGSLVATNPGAPASSALTVTIN